MNRLLKAQGRPSLGFLLLLLLLPSLASAQDVSASITQDQKKIRLSESVRVTLTIEGPAPLRVELPKPLLSPESDRDWKIQPLATATVTPAGAKREKWSQAFRLDPYVAGEWYVQFAPLKVNNRETVGPGCEVQVNSTIGEAKAEAARPVTPIEELPTPPPIRTDSVAVWWWVTGALVVLVVAGVGWRLRRKPAPIAPGDWATAAFARLERDGVGGAALVERVATVLREFIDRRFGIPASRLTTPELLAAAEQAGRPVEETDALRRVLDRCDRAKFAGDVPDDNGCRDLLAGARQWVHDVCAADARPG